MPRVWLCKVQGEFLSGKARGKDIILPPCLSFKLILAEPFYYKVDSCNYKFTLRDN